MLLLHRIKNFLNAHYLLPLMQLQYLYSIYIYTHTHYIYTTMLLGKNDDKKQKRYIFKQKTMF
jgi:hypothetical protein